MKILLTGGAGFIGSHVGEKLLERGDKVITLDNFNSYYDPAQKELNIQKALLHPDYKLYRADLRDYEKLQEIFEREQPDKICHLAAMAGVRYSIQFPMLYEEVNVRGTLHLLELARLHHVPQFVMASSSSVYGGLGRTPFSEENEVNTPLSPYAATKRATELLGYTYHNLYGLKITALRFFTVYGPRNRPDMACYLFTKAIEEGKPINLFGDGSARRDWTYVDDIVNGVIASLDRPFNYEIINLGNSNTQSEMDLICLAEKAVGKKAIINYLSRPATEPQITYANILKAQNLLGFRPTVKLEEGYTRFYNWYMESTKNYKGLSG